MKLPNKVKYRGNEYMFQIDLEWMLKLRHHKKKKIIILYFL